MSSAARSSTLGEAIRRHARRHAGNVTNGAQAPAIIAADGLKAAGKTADIETMDFITWLLCLLAPFIGSSLCETEPDFRIAVLPDTQHYAEDYPHHLATQTEWLADPANGIDLVLHVGDIVDENHDATQWANASRAFSSLDGKVPYVLAAGNHDYSGYDETTGSRISSYWDIFPASRQGLQDHHGESGFRIQDLAGEDWLILSLEMFPRTSTLDWADQVLEAHATKPTIIVTHAYLNVDGSRFGEADSYPWPYGLDPMRGVTGPDAWDAETIYRELVEPHSQVLLVLSGHVLGSGVGSRVDVRPDGTVAHQLVQNYQARLEGGLGFLRIYDGFDHHIEVSTYSPVLDYSLTDVEHAFTLPLGVSP